MKQAANQILLLLFSFIFLFILKTDMTFIAAMLVAVIYSSVNYFNQTQICQILSTLIYLCLGVYLPTFFLFLPLVIYTIAYSTTYALLLIAIGSFFFFIAFHSIPMLALLLLGCAFSYILHLHTDQYRLLDMQFRQTHDDNTEHNLLLTEKNQSLLDKQDYEIYTATLRERNRIAREIHDNVGHMLSRAILMTGALRTINTNASTKEPLSQLADTLNAAMTSVRNSVHDLHDESIHLENGLKGLADSFTFCEVQLEYDMGYDLPSSLKYSFISIAKEALSNIMRHSNASCVQIVAREHPGLYQLIIKDNGTLSHPIKETGLGLLNMRDRISALHGTIQFQTTSGFSIFIMIQKKEIHA